MKAYTVEIRHKGEPKHLIDLMAADAEGAERTAKNAMFMHALRDGREWKLEDIEADIWEEHDADGPDA